VFDTPQSPPPKPKRSDELMQQIKAKVATIDCVSIGDAMELGDLITRHAGAVAAESLDPIMTQIFSSLERDLKRKEPWQKDQDSTT
jgi:hypothetical protein